MNAPSKPTDPKTPARTPPKSSRPLWYGCIAIGVLWGIILVSLAMLTANPVTLNWDQIQMRAQVVVAAEVLEAETGQVRVKQIWKAAGKINPEDTLLIDNLKDTAAQTGQSYLIPLIKVGPTQGEYSIPLTQDQQLLKQKNKPGIHPLCYPLSEDAIQQLEAILAQPAPAEQGAIPR